MNVNWTIRRCERAKRWKVPADALPLTIDDGEGLLNKQECFQQYPALNRATTAVVSRSCVHKNTEWASCLIYGRPHRGAHERMGAGYMMEGWVKVESMVAECVTNTSIII